MFKVNKENTRTRLCFASFSSVSIADLEQANVSLIVLAYVVKVLRQRILFQKIGNGAVIRHVVGSTTEEVYWYFWHLFFYNFYRYFWSSRRAKKKKNLNTFKVIQIIMALHQYELNHFYWNWPFSYSALTFYRVKCWVQVIFDQPLNA